MTKQTVTLAALCALLMLGWGGVASAQTSSGRASSGQSLSHAPDGRWISLRGTVVAAGLDTILVHDGRRTFTVEVDDLDAYAEGAQILQDDRVVVFGQVDHDLFEERHIEASSVFLPSLGTYLFASAEDEEDRAEWAPGASPEPSTVSVTGTVTDLHGTAMTLTASGVRLRVDVSALSSELLRRRDPVEIGDRVRVTGRMVQDLLHGDELEAESLVEHAP